MKTAADFYREYLEEIQTISNSDTIWLNDPTLIKLLTLTEGYRAGEDMNFIKLGWVEGDGDHTNIAHRVAVSILELDKL
jgi:hypothetical protein